MSKKKFGQGGIRNSLTNIELAKAVLNQLASQGVERFILCPGARNAPFVSLIAKSQNKSVTFFEERSAGFYALGCAISSRRPVAVITTSGTAVANLLPPTIEAFYSGVPLVWITADRPKSYRGTGAPQTIVQPGIFGDYAHFAGDFDVENFADFEIRENGPTHVNICFDEPLIDCEVEEWQWASDLPPDRARNSCDTRGLKKLALSAKKPLILVSGLRFGHERVIHWLSKQRCPIYLEGCSGLRGLDLLSEIELQSMPQLTDYDAVVRIGGVPTLRLWRDLESSTIPVFNVSDMNFPGLAREDVTTLSMQALEIETRFLHSELAEVIARDRSRYQQFRAKIDREPYSELGLVHRLSQQIDPNDLVYLGNSLPIRNWDQAARRDFCVRNCFASRGANGIDGQISTFFGLCDPDRRNWALLGDLTVLYDLSAPWVLRESPVSFHLVIINNGGGKIFAPMFNEELFENRHSLNFRHWAEFWGLSYQLWDGQGEVTAQIVEIRPAQ